MEAQGFGTPGFPLPSFLASPRLGVVHPVAAGAASVAGDGGRRAAAQRPLRGTPNRPRNRVRWRVGRSVSLSDSLV